MNKIISFSTGSTALQSADEFADGFVAWWMKFRQIFEVLKEISEIRTVFVHDL